MVQTAGGGCRNPGQHVLVHDGGLRGELQQVEAVVLVRFQTLTALLGHRDTLDGDVRILWDLRQFLVGARNVLLKGFIVHTKDKSVVDVEGLMQKSTERKVVVVRFLLQVLLNQDRHYSLFLHRWLGARLLTQELVKIPLLVPDCVRLLSIGIMLVRVIPAPLGRRLLRPGDDRLLLGLEGTLLICSISASWVMRMFWQELDRPLETFSGSVGEVGSSGGETVTGDC